MKKVRLWVLSFVAMLGLGGILYSPITANAASDDIGTWGTIDWEFEASTGTLTFKNEGVIPPVGNITIEDNRNWVTSESTDGGNAIKKIVFDQTCVLPTNSRYLFSNLSNLEELEGVDKLDISNARDMGGMFLDDNKLENLDELTNWDVSNVTSMIYLFKNTNIRNVNNLANWNLGNVSDISEMFWGCENLEDISALANWNVSNVTSMIALFYDDKKIEDFTPIANWNVEKVKYFGYFFENTSIENTDVLAKWNPKEMTSMNGMFQGCENLKSVDFSSWNTRNVPLDMFHMLNVFSGCSKLSSITLGENSIFGSIVKLPAINTTNGNYSGEWIGVNTGNIYTSSDDFMDNYDGNIPDTYVWRETPNEDPVDQSTINVQDSTLYVGDEWNPEDNFVDATDKDENELAFDSGNIEWFGEADTSTPGEYEVVYKVVDFEYGEAKLYRATATATITVIPLDTPPQPPTYNADYVFESGTTGKALPKAVTDLLPSDTTDYANDDTVTAIAPAQTTITASGGTWTFQGWDADTKTVSGDDVIFTGTWTFEANEPVTSDNPNTPNHPNTPDTPDTPSNPDKPITPDKPNHPATQNQNTPDSHQKIEKVTTEFPKTGDTQLSGLWGIAFLLSGITLLILKIRKRKIG